MAGVKARGREFIRRRAKEAELLKQSGKSLKVTERSHQIAKMAGARPKQREPLIPEEPPEEGAISDDGAKISTETGTTPKNVEELLVWLVKRQEIGDQRRLEEERFYREQERYRMEKEEQQRKDELRHQEAERAKRDDQFLKLLQAMQHNMPPVPSLKLTKLSETDDIEAYLTVFERVAQASQWPENQWVIHLAPFLTSKAQQAYSQMRIEDAGDYQKVKSSILRRYNIHTETFRQRFRGYIYIEKEGPRETYTRLTELCQKWIVPENKTVQQVLQTIILEQFLEILPEPLRVWLKEHQPESGDQAVILAENYLLARKGLSRKMHMVRATPVVGSGDKPRQDTLKNKGHTKDVICFLCHKVGHLAKDCLSKRVKSGKETVTNCVGVVNDYLQPVKINSKTVKALVDTGSQQSLIRSNLLASPNVTGQLPLKCVHGDTKIYPKTVLPVEIANTRVSLEMGIVPNLPYPVILGQDTPGFSDILNRDSKVSAVSTRSQVKSQTTAENLGEIFPFEKDVFQGTGGKKSKLVPVPLVDTPFERVAMDIVGPLQKSSKGNQYILVVSDYMTRYPEAIPLRSITTRKIAEELIKLFSHMGIPQTILTDQGSNFQSSLMRQINQLLGIQAVRTSPYHPQTDGLVERFNQTLKKCSGSL
ncbi:uncharacterized protein LOC121403156 [Xenopus laevis]|uniref:Uncharacterized protein LOC121403156 n=1 Tax=Xenopus laevis TaxID=8355 RepID=A0A8J1MZS2_XENLA|nr:uncharacterized protein LOC121403156 [Xenopus laevis]